MRTPNPALTLVRKTFTYAALLAWSLICIIPLYWVGITSFKGADIIDQAPTYVPYFDFTPSLEAWRFILGDLSENLVWRAFNSVVIGTLSTLATLALGGMLVYGVTRFTSTFKGTSIMTALLATRILPPVVLALPLYYMAQMTGTLDSLGILIFVYTAINLPIAIWLLAPVLGSRATDQEEAAQLDGASHFHIFFFILVPMAKTAVITIGLLIFLQCWNEYLFAAFLTSDHALTLPPWMVGQLSMKEAQTGGGAEEVAHLAAATVLMILPVLLFTIFVQKSLTHVFLGKNRKST
jgi:multiple sugar transport system permease protein